VLHAGESEDGDDSCICYIEDNSPFEVISDRILSRMTT
jgi:hypothetical protein